MRSVMKPNVGRSDNNLMENTMDYLSEMCPIYTREVSPGWVEKREHTEVVWDEWEMGYFSCDTNRRVEQTSERPAEWWAVAVYTSDRAYGGPEEGGWWYNCGELVEHSKIKFFGNHSDAYAYSQELWAWCLEENKDRGDVKLVVRAFTEQMPDSHYPLRRPYYS
jgi:hypothetical protein